MDFRKMEVNMELATVEEAIKDIKAGKFVIVVDDEDRENEGDLVIAAQHAGPDAINFMARHGCGLICLPMTGEMLDRLEIPMMVPSARNGAGFGTNFTVSVEARHGISTGISAFDRSRTVGVLIDPDSKPDDIVMPGHVFPLRAKAGGVLERRGQTEAAVDLARMAGLMPAGVICEVMSENGAMARLPELIEFGQTHGIKVISVEALVRHRNKFDSHGEDMDASVAAVIRGAATKLPTDYGTFKAVSYLDLDQNREHLFLQLGEFADTIPLARIHSGCLTGDVLGSRRCDCRQQLELAMKRIAEEEKGVLVYLKQEGRGIGLGNKIRAYSLQDRGYDTVDANLKLGFPADDRSYELAATILIDQNINRIRLMTNNPHKVQSLKAHGIHVAERVPLEVVPSPENIRYLKTKTEKLGHIMSYFQ